MSLTRGRWFPVRVIKDKGGKDFPFGQGKIKAWKLGTEELYRRH